MNAHTIRLNLNDRRPLLASLRRRELWLKSIATVVTVAFLGLYLQPLAIAANLPSRAPAKTPAPSNEEKLAQALETIEQRLDQLHTKLSTEDKGAKAEQALRSDIDALDHTARLGLSEIEKGIKTKTPSQTLLERHTKNIAAYQRAITTLSTRVDQALKEGLVSGTTNTRLSLQALRASITKLDKNTREGLNTIGRELKHKKTATVILNRHKTIAKQYQTDITNVKAALDTWATAMADAKRTAKGKPQPKHDTAQDTAALKSLRTDLDALDRQAIADFNTIEQHIKDKNLPAIILQRHREAVATYETEMAAVKANLDAIGSATNDTARTVRILKARDHLKAKQAKKGPKTKFDPNDLPNKSLQPNPNNKPKLTPGEFVRAGLISNPTVKLAAHGSFRIDQLPNASDPAYLAATTEVTLTDAIRAKAAELNHDPIQIYNWVRNNVEWIPTWGATQDADVTLGSKRGNAMDIASLLIALLRASDIPARYVHGTIEVPADNFMNWAGGFTDVKAAGDYASSGGIPTTGIVTGGKITKLQMEHIWVEAAIDFQPSRGAINRSADSWVQLDASYKQYDYVKGLDIIAMSGINAEALTQSFASSGAVNIAEGWVTGLNPAVLRNAQSQTQIMLENYVNENLENGTVGDLIGGRKIIPHLSSVLPATLPYRQTVSGARFGTLPNQLQNAMTFGFGTDFLGDPVISVTLPWPRLNNHKITLSFEPATEADEQTLKSLVPTGPITHPSQLPRSIPSYLVNVIPRIAVDGQVIVQGNAMRLGEDLSFYFGIQHVSNNVSHSYTYAVAAGSYLSIAVAGGSVSSNALQTLRGRLQQTKATLDTGNAQSIGMLAREHTLGDVYQAGVLGYFAQYLALLHTASVSQELRYNLPIAYGSIGYEPNVSQLFGFPRAISSGGIGVNVRLSQITSSSDGDASRAGRFGLHAGMLSSALEHVVPEQILSTPTQTVEGISAVKALQIASQQGQRIYHITQANQFQVLPNLRLDALALTEINQALATGREVVAHTDRISVPGWTGEGYILVDPQTGSGAYKIAGGTNGGFATAGNNDGMFFAAAGGDNASKTLYEVIVDFVREVFFYIFNVIDVVAKANLVIQVFEYFSKLQEISDACNGTLFWLGAWAFTVLTATFFITAILSGGSLGFLIGLMAIVVLALALQALKYECVLRTSRRPEPYFSRQV